MEKPKVYVIIGNIDEDKKPLSFEISNINSAYLRGGGILTMDFNAEGTHLVVGPKK